MTRYVSEATQALVEVKLKMSDVPAAVKTCALFHRRYADFASEMMSSWKRVLPLHKGDPIANPSKLRVDLKLVPELIASGILPMKAGFHMLITFLQVVIENDKEDRALLPLISTFAKNFGFEFIGE